MTPAQIIALVRDAIILVALAAILYFLYRSGENAIKVQDLTALQKQLAANSAIEAQWTAQQAAAEKQRANDMQTISSAIAAQRTPVYIVRNPARSGSVPSPAGTTSGQCPAVGPTDQGSRVDIRGAVNAFELKYESALADCRAALASWPK